MYCYNCGKEIPQESKFCPYCGTVQGKKKGNGGNGSKKVGLIVVLVLILMAAMVIFVMGSNGPSDSGSSDSGKITREPTIAAEETWQNAEETFGQEDGWQTLYGDRYYFEDGKMYVELHEIDGELYYFDEEGILQVDQDIDYEDVTLHADYDGHISEITYDAVFGSWSEEKYRFEGSGRSSIMEFASEVEDCDSFRFCLEASGARGAKVNGNWKVHIRCNGKWEYVNTFDFTEPSGYMDVKFETPKTFDAITAYPTVRGNASYSALFYLEDVHCYY